MRKVELAHEPALVRDYVEGLMRTTAIGVKWAVSERQVRRILKRNGVEGLGTTPRNCAKCGQPLTITRCRARKTYSSYCSRECWTAKLREVPFQRSVYGMRKARQVVRNCGFDLRDGQVVHHIDKDQANNAPENLIVFASQGDHIRWHRCGGEDSGVVPVWRGYVRPLKAASLRELVET